MFCKIVSFSQLREEKVSCLLMIQSVVFLTRNSFVLFGQNCVFFGRSVLAGRWLGGSYLSVEIIQLSARVGGRARGRESIQVWEH